MLKARFEPSFRNSSPALYGVTMLSCCASWKSGSAGTTEDVIGHTFQLRAVKIPQCGEQNFDILYRVEVPGTDAHRTCILVAAQVLMD